MLSAFSWANVNTRRALWVNRSSLSATLLASGAPFDGACNRHIGLAQKEITGPCSLKYNTTWVTVNGLPDFKNPALGFKRRRVFCVQLMWRLWISAFPGQIPRFSTSPVIPQGCPFERIAAASGPDARATRCELLAPGPPLDPSGQALKVWTFYSATVSTAASATVFSTDSSASWTGSSSGGASAAAFC
jgi:hypothetical protein